MTQPLLEDGEQLGIVARLGVNHAGGGQSGLVEARSEQVARTHDPKHVAACPGGDPRYEQYRRGVVTPTGAAR